LYKVYNEFPEIKKELLLNAEKKLKNFLQIKRDAKEYARASKAAKRHFKDIDENKEEYNLSIDEKGNSKSSVEIFSERKESEESKSKNSEKEFENLENSETKARDPYSSTKSLEKVKTLEKSHRIVLGDKIKEEKLQNIQNRVKSPQSYLQPKKREKEMNVRGIKKRSKEKESEKKVENEMEKIRIELKGRKLEDGVRRQSMVERKQQALCAQLGQKHDPSQIDGECDGACFSGKCSQSIGSLRKNKSSPPLHKMPPYSENKQLQSESPPPSDRNIPKSYKLKQNKQVALPKISSSLNYPKKISKTKTYSHLDIPHNIIISFSTQNINHNQNQSSQRDELSSIASTHQFLNQYFNNQESTVPHNKT
jgi:hypothetical protein